MIVPQMKTAGGRLNTCTSSTSLSGVILVRGAKHISMARIDTQRHPASECQASSRLRVGMDRRPDAGVITRVYMKREQSPVDCIALREAPPFLTLARSRQRIDIPGLVMIGFDSGDSDLQVCHGKRSLLLAHLVCQSHAVWLRSEPTACFQWAGVYTS